jgi:hypothetical protein
MKVPPAIKQRQPAHGKFQTRCLGSPIFSGLLFFISVSLSPEFQVHKHKASPNLRLFLAASLLVHNTVNAMALIFLLYAAAA